MKQEALYKVAMMVTCLEVDCQDVEGQPLVAGRIQQQACGQSSLIGH